jgi:hypothetical protein
VRVLFNSQSNFGYARRATLAAAAVLTLSTAAQAAEGLVLLCKGTEYCSSCAADQKRVDFDWTYTIDLDASTVDGLPATISDERITWELAGNGVVDKREISRYSKKFHFAATPTGGGVVVYYGDGDCEPQTQKAF